MSETITGEIEINAPNKVTTMEPAAQVPAAPITPMRMLEIAVNQGADLDKLTKLMDLQERWEATEARKAYVKALAEFKKEPPTVKKNKSASFGGKGGTAYDYATLAQVANAIAPALSAQGLSHRWSTDQSDKGISVTCTLTHEMGHSETVTLSASADNSGSKNTIQAIGSTVTYLQRYTLLAITGLATEDMDDDGDDGGVGDLVSPEQKDQLIALIKELEADTAAFLKYVGYVSLDAIPATMFDRAVNALKQKRKKRIDD